MIKIANIKEKINNSDKKTKTLLGNISISFVIKGLALIISFLLTPAYIKYFNNNTVLGCWFTIISILNYICSFDIGIGNGLRNILVEKLNEDNKQEIKKIISTSYIMVMAIGLVIVLIFTISINYIPWNNILNISYREISQRNLMLMLYIIFIGVIIHFIFNLINPICYAMQRSFIPSLITISNNVIILIALLLSNVIKPSNKIIYISFANVISILIPYLVATIIIFKKNLKNCFISIYSFDIKYGKNIIKLGMKFLYLQIVALLMFSTNEILINNFTMPENVVTYQIYNKLFYVIATIFALMLTPLWSAVKEAKVQNDYKWIKNIYSKTNKLLLVTIPILIILVICFKPIIYIWLGKGNGIEINIMYLILFAIYYWIYMKVNIISSFVSGLEKLKMNTIVITICCILKFIIGIYVLKCYQNWIIVIVINAVILIPYIIFVGRDIRKEIKNNVK